jgi:hypothetical protein
MTPARPSAAGLLGIRGHLDSAALTRRRLLGGFVGSVASCLVCVGLPRGIARAAQLPPEDPAAPKPIPGGIRNTHHFLPGRGAKVSTIDDFDGVVGIAHLAGSGTGTLADGATVPLTYLIDNRFMVGEYLGVDGAHRSGTFAEF